MAIQVNCPHCETAASVRDESAGKSVRCKVCQGTIRVPAVVEDSADEFGVPEKARRKGKSKSKSGSGTPLGLVFAMACVGVLMLLNLWELASGDDLVWKLIAVLRLFVEARVIWGLREKQDETALTATVAATMMTLLSCYLLFVAFADPELKVEMTASELVASKVYFSLQALAEIGVIVGLNLPASRAFLAKK